MYQWWNGRGSAEAGKYRDLLTSVARMSYLDGLGQQEIADILGVSRSKISRLLTAAREQGIVRISVDQYDPRDHELEARVMDRFGLRRAIVVRTMGGAVEHVRRTIGYYAAPSVASLILPAARVGVAGGRTLREVVRFLAPSPEVPGVSVAQLMGNIGPTPSSIDAPELSRELAQRLGGTFFTLNAPAFVTNEAARQVLLAQDDVQLVWGSFNELQVALVGIGSLDDSAFVERGALAAEDVASLRAAGAVGEICGRFFDADGRELDTPFRERVISIELEVLRSRPEVVGVTNGPRRARAIAAALHGGLITLLVIDDRCAEALLASSAEGHHTGV